jgi:hypothetical protein
LFCLNFKTFVGLKTGRIIPLERLRRRVAEREQKFSRILCALSKGVIWRFLKDKIK